MRRANLFANRDGLDARGGEKRARNTQDRARVGKEGSCERVDKRGWETRGWLKVERSTAREGGERERGDSERRRGKGTENIMFPTARGVVYFTIWRAI